jgi:hypothetical protein
MTNLVLNIAAGNLSKSLSIMVQGMMGIFIFMGIFYLLVYSLDKIFKTRDEK